MAINSSNFSAQSISQNGDVSISLLAQPPSGAAIDPAATPGILYGWYNDATGAVQLYITSPDGTRYVRIK